METVIEKPQSQSSGVRSFLFGKLVMPVQGYSEPPVIFPNWLARSTWMRIYEEGKISVKMRDRKAFVVELEFVLWQCLTREPPLTWLVSSLSHLLARVAISNLKSIPGTSYTFLCDEQ